MLVIKNILDSKIKKKEKKVEGVYSLS